ncbi:MAG: signal peptidase I [Pirellulales bacterium]
MSDTDATPFSPKLPQAPVATAAKPPHSVNRTVRETVESIVVAFILAFLFRTFEAEAFVIPTGSMAPTLQGRHKDFTCPECGYRYRVNASGEVEDESSILEFRPDNNRVGGDRRAGRMVFSGLCPLCRFPATELDKKPSFNGDRILVGKFPYDFADPERWDVVVFKYPGDAKTNFIKRLVGLPKETVRIYRGDLYVKPEGAPDDAFKIARKPPEKVQAMLQEVYSSDYPAPDLEKSKWPARWQPWPAGAAGGWTTADHGRSFQLAADGGEHWLRYQHILPTSRDWRELRAQASARPGADPTLSDRMRPQLITDFYAYNTGRSRDDFNSQPNSRIETLGLHWVGDLAVDCTLEVGKAQGTALFDLVEGGQHFRCSIDLGTGAAALSTDGAPQFAPKAQTSVRGPGSYEICFANVDDQLLLWVDGRVVQFDQPTTFDQFDLPTGEPVSTPRDLGDLAPVGVGGKDAELTVRHLRVRRDIYYIAGRKFGGLVDYDFRGNNFRFDAEDLAELMSNPARWSAFDNLEAADYPLAEDQFFVLGDNSPYSKDSRLWSEESLPGALHGNKRLGHYVDRDLLVGKALFIYWPHSDGVIPGTSIPFPFFPNVPKMGFVR